MKAKPSANQEKHFLQTLRIFMQALLCHKADAALASLNLISALLTGIAMPFYISRTLASIMASSQATVKNNLIILATVSVCSVITNRVGHDHFMLMQAKILRDLNRRIFSRLLARSSGFHHNNISGKIISDTLDFLTAYMGFLNVLMSGSIFVMTVLLGLVVIFLSSWQLGMFVSAVVIILAVWIAHESFRRSELRSHRLAATKALTAHIADTVVNAQAVKAFARETDEIRDNVKYSQKLYDLRTRDWLRGAHSGNSRRGFLVVTQLLLVAFIAQHVKQHPEAMAAGIFAFTYTLTLTIRLFDVDVLIRQAEESFLNASPITKMLGEEVEIQDAPDARRLRVTRGEISFQDVHFAYGDNHKNQHVFANLTMHIRGGEKVGLVGPSGGGKSTLTRILLRFEDIQSGAVSIDGQDIRDITQESLRKNIAYVPQEPMLFHRTIRENISYGKPGATIDEIRRAARLAHADKFIQSLADGYETVVGERGVKLSGGQRQRIAIARAILKDAPILVLDEATSALDSESEKLIQASLNELMNKHTTIVVAHRLSTIQKMDRIIVLSEGKIVEEGSHKELLGKKGLYARLWEHQSGGFIK
jgi:ATP-binding cassette, subfamily B, bacterial